MPRPCLARRSEMSSGAGQCSLRALYKVAHHDCRWADRIDQTNPLACEAGHDVLACGLDARRHDRPRKHRQIGRASWRGGVYLYVSITVVAVSLKKKYKQ